MAGQINTGKIIKKINLIFAAVYIFSGVWSLISGGLSGIISIFIPICTILFGLMMVAGDFEIKIILENCGFLDNLVGRGLFNMFCGGQLIMGSNGTDNTLNLINGICGWILFVVGIALIGYGICTGKKKVSDAVQAVA